MAIKTANVVPKIQWDDSVVFVFSFVDGGTTFFAGFVHQQLSQATVAGSQIQINSILAQILQSQLQVASDPQSWLDTIKTSSRSGNAIVINYEDSVSTIYTTQIPTLSFTLQQLFSLAG
jgi:hypothetical protein